MINRLIVLRADDETFEVIEPVTRTIIEKGIALYAFAVAFAVGFIDCMDANLHNTREELAKREFCLPKLLGHRAADEVCKAYFEQGGILRPYQDAAIIGGVEK